MKLANAIATSAVVMVAIASPTSALQGRVERVLILSGEPVPSGTKAYVAGLRIPTACEEAPHHAHSRSHRVALHGVRSSLGDHYRNETQAGEQIKVVKFKPMELAAADDSDFKPGTIATTMGWGKNAETNGNFSYELQRVDVPLLAMTLVRHTPLSTRAWYVREALRIITRVRATPAVRSSSSQLKAGRAGRYSKLGKRRHLRA
ncbi:Peptidase S1, PA clan [Phytophthora cactorum]|nr:Peptidase S1, PA clan [Phytophthora cactorum]